LGVRGGVVVLRMEMQPEKEDYFFLEEETALSPPVLLGKSKDAIRYAGDEHRGKKSGSTWLKTLGKDPS